MTIKPITYAAKTKNLEKYFIISWTFEVGVVNAGNCEAESCQFCIFVGPRLNR